MTDVLVTPKVKVCGLTDPTNALACALVGADWIGLNFHPASPRSISVERGAEIARVLSNHAQAVGLFVNSPLNEVVEAVQALEGMDTIQLHGDEPPEYLLDLARIRPTLRVVRAFRLSDASSIDRLLAYLGRTEQLGCPPFAVLVDAHVPGLPGGSGQSIPFDVLTHLPVHPRLVLAGGLDPSNVFDRVVQVRPWMVDVASGVESSPGVKDLARVSAFVAAARGLATTSGQAPLGI